MNLGIAVLYFGKLPSLTGLWLKSCEKNSDIDFILITNDKKPNNLPSNVIYVYSDPKDFENRVNHKLNIDCNLSGRVYKTCDYRPLFNIIYDDILGKYDYFGQCELDMIFGKISDFIDSNLLTQYRKLFTYGHLTIYKNDDFILKKLDYKFGNDYTYRSLLEKPFLCNCDEQFHKYSINQLFDELGEQIYEEGNSSIGDIAQEHFRFVLYDHSKREAREDKNEHIIFSWEDGKIIGHYLNKRSKEIKEREFLYIHLQKRKMDDMLPRYDNLSKYLIVPNKFITYRRIDSKLILNNSKTNIFYKQFYKTHLNGLKLRINRLKTKNDLNWEVGSYRSLKMR